MVNSNLIDCDYPDLILTFDEGIINMKESILISKFDRLSTEFYEINAVYEDELRQLKSNYLNKLKNLVAKNNLSKTIDKESSYKLDEILNDHHFFTYEDIEDIDLYSGILWDLCFSYNDLGSKAISEDYPELLTKSN